MAKTLGIDGLFTLVWTIYYNMHIIILVAHRLLFSWLGKQNNAAEPGSFIPFGGGSRRCLGIDVAKIEVCIFLHYFLLNYKWVFFIYQQNIYIFFSTITFKLKRVDIATINSFSLCIIAGWNNLILRGQ